MLKINEIAVIKALNMSVMVAETLQKCMDKADLWHMDESEVKQQ